MLYVIQHHGGNIFSSADDIDPVYGHILREAVTAGVAIEAWKAKVSPIEIRLNEKIPIDL